VPRQRVNFEVASSKTAPSMRCFETFDFQMCFAPRWRAYFRSCIFQNCSGHEVFCHF
jgi:hypothetical protein